MRKEEYFYSAGITYKRITKAAARKLYEAGKNIVLCPCNLRPFSFWHPEIETNKEQSVEASFYKLVNEFEFYNCTNSETGKYTNFYTAI